MGKGISWGISAHTGECVCCNASLPGKRSKGSFLRRSTEEIAGVCLDKKGSSDTWSAINIDQSKEQFGFLVIV